MIYRLSAQAPFTFSKILQSKSGNAYGGISSLDVVTSPTPEMPIDAEYLIAGTETGEIH